MIQRLFHKYQVKFQNFWYQRSLATRDLILSILHAFQNFAQNGFSQSAALSYYAIFSIFPLTLLLTLLIARVLGPTFAQTQVLQALGLFLPANALDLLQETIDQALNQGGQFTIIAIVGLFWSALGLFSNISRSIDIIFESTRRNLWQQRLIALLMAIILFVLIAMSFVTSGVIRIIATFAPASPNNWISIGLYFLPFGVNLLIFILLLRYVPATYVHWEVVWSSAIVGAVGWELAKNGLVWYLENYANFSAVYGSIATVIVLLLSAYITSAIMIFSAELCAQLNKWYKKYRTHSTLYLESGQLAETEVPPYFQ